MMICGKVYRTTFFNVKFQDLRATINPSKIIYLLIFQSLDASYIGEILDPNLDHCLQLHFIK